MKRKPDDGTTATISVHGGPEIPFTTPAEIAAAGDVLREAVRPMIRHLAADERRKGAPMRTMKLTCTLTQDERLQRADALACLVTERADADEARKEAAKLTREAIEEMDGRIAEYARVVRDGCERRDVEVEDRREGLLLVTHRADTGEIVESRPLTAAERQETLAPVVRLGREGANGR